MNLSFSDFLSDNTVIVIIIILGGILGIVYYFRRKLFSKYDDIDNELNQTPEEILQEELDNLLVTERYNPNEKKKKDILDEDDDYDYDYDYDENIASDTSSTLNDQTDDFVMNTDASYSLPSYEEDNNN